MKVFKLMAIALVAMLGLNSCSNEQNFIEVDHSADLVGTWTCLEANYASSLVFTADGKVVSSGLSGGEYWEDMNGVFSTENNQLSISFENGHTFDGRLDVVANRCMSIANEDGTLHTYNYCANDLSDEIIGMWVCTNTTVFEDKIAINTYKADGTAIFTGFLSETVGYMVNLESSYKIIGDLMIQKTITDVSEDATQYMAFRLNYSPNGTNLGDIITFNTVMASGDEVIESSSTHLRIKQTLDLAEKKYDYIKIFVTNVKGLDKDIDFMGYTFNFAKMDGVMMDKALKAILFNVEFPDASTIKYGCHYNNEPMAMEAPIAVDGNKMTVKMSEKNAAFRDIDLYTFQDQDNTQMHMYMPTYAFVNFFGNMQCTMMSQLGQLDLTDAAAVKAVYDSIDDAVEAINVSFVMTKAAR